MTESALKRKSSQAAACGTRAFIISQRARAAMSEEFARSAVLMTSSRDNVSACAVIPPATNARRSRLRRQTFPLFVRCGLL